MCHAPSPTLFVASFDASCRGPDSGMFPVYITQTGSFLPSFLQNSHLFSSCTSFRFTSP